MHFRSGLFQIALIWLAACCRAQAARSARVGSKLARVLERAALRLEEAAS
jgi:hypothetical protein